MSCAWEPTRQFRRDPDRSLGAPSRRERLVHCQIEAALERAANAFCAAAPIGSMPRLAKQAAPRRYA